MNQKNNNYMYCLSDFSHDYIIMQGDVIRIDSLKIDFFAGKKAKKNRTNLISKESIFKIDESTLHLGFTRHLGSLKYVPINPFTPISAT